jgi:ABC-type phosphate/phosphonate transport system substrate-binding protein
LRILATTGAIPNDALVVSNRLAADVRLALVRWILAISGSRAQALSGELFGADAFRVASPTHFEPLRRLVAMARMRAARPS